MGVITLTAKTQAERLSLLRELGERLRRSEGRDTEALDLAVVCWLETMRYCFPHRKALDVFDRMVQALDEKSREMSAVASRFQETKKLIEEYRAETDAEHKATIKKELIRRGILH